MKGKEIGAIAFAVASLLVGCAQKPQGYAEKILNNPLMNQVDSMARAVVATGFNAGDGYGEVWIRDYNTFIELSMEVLPDEQVRHNLNVFWGFQGENGGDWTWFGARMIQALVEHGMIAEAYEELQPMLERVVENQGFNEWYTPAGEPMGSGTFRGEAGVLYKANALLREWAKAQ